MASVAPKADNRRAVEEALERMARTALLITSTSILLNAFPQGLDDDGTAGVPAVTR